MHTVQIANCYDIMIYGPNYLIVTVNLDSAFKFSNVGKFKRQTIGVITLVVIWQSLSGFGRHIFACDICYFQLSKTFVVFQYDPVLDI